MGRAAKRKRTKAVGNGVPQKDFVKKKAKLGHKSRPENSTDVTVRTRQIHLPRQDTTEHEGSLAKTSTSISSTVDQHILRTSHHNASARHSAFNGIRNLLNSNTSSARPALNIRLPTLLTISGTGLADTTRVVRRSAADLLCSLISTDLTGAQSSSPSRTRSMLPSLTPHILAALSNVRHDVRVDTARLLSNLVQPPCSVHPLHLFPTTNGQTQNPLPALSHLLAASREPGYRVTTLNALTNVLDPPNPIAYETCSKMRHSSVQPRFFYHARHPTPVTTDLEQFPSLLLQLSPAETINMAKRIAHVISESLPATDGGGGHTDALVSGTRALVAVGRDICSADATDCNADVKDIICKLLNDCVRVEDLLVEGFGERRGKGSDEIAVALAEMALNVGENNTGLSLLRRSLGVVFERDGGFGLSVRLIRAIRRAFALKEGSVHAFSESNGEGIAKSSCLRKESNRPVDYSQLRKLVADVVRIFVNAGRRSDRTVLMRILPLAGELVAACPSLELMSAHEKLFVRSCLARAVMLCSMPPSNDKACDGKMGDKGGNSMEAIPNTNCSADLDDNEYCVGEKAMLMGLEIFEVVTRQYEVGEAHTTEHVPSDNVLIRGIPRSCWGAAWKANLSLKYGQDLVETCVHHQIVSRLSMETISALAGVAARTGPDAILQNSVIKIIGKGLKPYFDAASNDVCERDEHLFKVARVFLDAIESVIRRRPLSQAHVRRVQALLVVLDQKFVGAESAKLNDICDNLEKQAVIQAQIKRMFDIIRQNSRTYEM